MEDVYLDLSVTLCFLFRLSAGQYPKLAKYYRLLKDRASIKSSCPPTPTGCPAHRDMTS